MIMFLLAGTMGRVDGCDEEKCACSDGFSGVIPGSDPLEAMDRVSWEGSGREQVSS